MHASGKQLHCICFHAAENQRLLALIPNRANCRTWRFCSQEEPRHPPFSTFDFNYMGTCLGWGLLPELSWPRWRRPCAVAQKSFLKVHAGSLSCCQSCTFFLARFLALLGQSNAKALSCSSVCVLSSPFPAAALPLTVVNVPLLFRTRIISKKITPRQGVPSSWLTLRRELPVW